MEITDRYIQEHYFWGIAPLFRDEGLGRFIYEKHDLGRVKKLLTIKSLDNYWDEVRKFTKKITSDHSIKCWQFLAEKRLIQLDLQQNYYIDDTNTKVLKREA